MRATRRKDPDDGYPGRPVCAVADSRPPAVDRPGTADLDEQTLVVRAQEGDARAFEELALRHQAALYRVAVRVLGDPTDAQDALQDALLDAWRQIARFRGTCSFATWMYRVVTNRCLDLLRRRRSSVSVDEVAEPSTGVERSPERTVEVDAGLVALGIALRALPDDQRVCWVLRELEGLSYAEIAEVTAASETAVRGRIYRARIRLAEVMRPWR